ncbi:MAG: phosphomannomutase/phosphoglucomutase [Aquificaceae bacterium]|nr:MAG: phosphomannomutase/phosphoglucomutase [Aquificaceae bacterium]
MGEISKEIFRAYDIRGEIGKDFIPQDAYQIGLSIGSQLQSKQSPQVLLGRDARISSPELTKALTQGLLDTGCEVIDLGIIPTPALYFGLSHLHIANGLMVTASHNPANHNGIKMVMDNHPLSAAEIQCLYQRIASEDFLLSTLPAQPIIKQDILPAYSNAIINDVSLKRPLKIAIDCSNGVASLIAHDLFNRLGCEVHTLYCELDGTFPNHSPDPTKPENLQALQELVIRKQLDIGIAFDGDADRMIAVDKNGKILWPDRIMILLANSILKHYPNKKIAFDVKCSFLLPQAIKKAGGKPSMCISGHSSLKSHMKEIDAIMGGEFSGHIILRDRWSDYDDALYNAARLLEILSEFTLSPTQIFAEIADSYSTPEYHLYFDNALMAKEAIKNIREQALFPLAKHTLIDGLRIDYNDCWGLVRASNTSPTLSFRFEATTPQRLEMIQQQFRDLLKRVISHLTLPF